MAVHKENLVQISGDMSIGTWMYVINYDQDFQYFSSYDPNGVSYGLILENLNGTLIINYASLPYQVSSSAQVFKDGWTMVGVSVSGDNTINSTVVWRNEKDTSTNQESLPVGMAYAAMQNFIVGKGDSSSFTGYTHSLWIEAGLKS